jgi:hypothetical protein
MLEITVTAPFPVGDLVARVDLDDGGAAQVVLRDGHFHGPVGGPPVRVTLTTAPAPTGEAPLASPVLDQPGAPAGTPVELRAAFEEGIAVPEGGRLAIQLTWGAACHDRVPDAPGEGTRFGSWEHILCARAVGLDEAGATLVRDGVDAWFNVDTRLTVGGSALRFGEIIALAGDFYAHLDDTAAAKLAWAWPEARGLVGWVAGDYRATTLTGDDPKVVRTILDVVARDKDEAGGIGHEIHTVVADGVFGRYPARRYLALASQNFCHFGAQPPDGSIRDADNEALRLYGAYHRRALDEAAAAAQAPNPRAAFERALITDAFACHFLTDLFASGHIRVPRRVLGERYGELRGGLSMAATMHGEDNQLGLWCMRRTPKPDAPRIVWRVYGDGALRKPESTIHLAQVQEAVRRSVAEIFTVYAAASTRGVPCCDTLATIPPEERAEALIPVVLPPGTTPRPGDVLPDETPAPQVTPNPWPLYWLLADGRLAERLGGPEQSRYTIHDARGHRMETVEMHA